MYRDAFKAEVVIFCPNAKRLVIEDNARLLYLFHFALLDFQQREVSFRWDVPDRSCSDLKVLGFTLAGSFELRANNGKPVSEHSVA